MYPVLFEFGRFQIRSYGVIVGLSFLIALWMSTKEAERKGLDPKLVQDFASYGLLGGIVGARLYFVLFSAPGYFLEHPWEIYAVWSGGIGIIGSLLGGSLVAVWFCRRKKISLLKFGDTLSPGVALGQTLGQFACLSNGDSYGRPTDLPWAHYLYRSSLNGAVKYPAPSNRDLRDGGLFPGFSDHMEDEKKVHVRWFCSFHISRRLRSSAFCRRLFPRRPGAVWLGNAGRAGVWYCDDCGIVSRISAAQKGFEIRELNPTRWRF